MEGKAQCRISIRGGLIISVSALMKLCLRLETNQMAGKCILFLIHVNLVSLQVLVRCHYGVGKEAHSVRFLFTFIIIVIFPICPNKDE